MKEYYSASDEYPGGQNRVSGSEFGPNGSGGAGNGSASESWITCPRCGYPIAPNADGSQVMYCPQCGARIGGGPTGAWVRQSAPSAGKSSHRVRNIVLIALGAIFVIALLIVVSTTPRRGTQDSFPSSSSSGVAGQEIPYTKGEFNGMVYHNDWANLHFDLPIGFENASKDYYALYDENSDDTECGLFLISDSIGEIIVTFEKVSGSMVTENMYLDINMRSANTMFQEQGISTEMGQSDSEDIYIGSERYITREIDYSAMGTTFTYSCYVRQIDDRMCAIQIIGKSGDENDALARSLTVSESEHSVPGDVAQDKSGITYTKGVLSDGVYTNKWADLRLTVPEGFQNAPEESYTAAASGGGECGLYLSGEEGQVCTVLFGDTVAWISDPKLYLKENVEKLVAEMFQEGYSAAWDGLYEDIQIAGNTYIGAHISVNANGVSAAESVYARKINNKLCLILITGASQEVNNTLTEQFAPCGEY